MVCVVKFGKDMQLYAAYVCSFRSINGCMYVCMYVCMNVYMGMTSTNGHLQLKSQRIKLVPGISSLQM
jgi:hypothetical protein